MEKRKKFVLSNGIFGKVCYPFHCVYNAIGVRVGFDSRQEGKAKVLKIFSGSRNVDIMADGSGFFVEMPVHEISVSIGGKKAVIEHIGALPDFLTEGGKISVFYIDGRDRMHVILAK